MLRLSDWFHILFVCVCVWGTFVGLDHGYWRVSLLILVGLALYGVGHVLELRDSEDKP